MKFWEEWDVRVWIMNILSWIKCWSGVLIECQCRHLLDPLSQLSSASSVSFYKFSGPLSVWSVQCVIQFSLMNGVLIWIPIWNASFSADAVTPPVHIYISTLTPLPRPVRLMTLSTNSTLSQAQVRSRHSDTGWLHTLSKYAAELDPCGRPGVRIN